MYKRILVPVENSGADRTIVDHVERLRDELAARGLKVEARLTMGDPAAQIVKVAEETGADLIAMATHGHRGLGDVLRGQTADAVRHQVKVPVLLLRAKSGG